MQITLHAFLSFKTKSIVRLFTPLTLPRITVYRSLDVISVAPATEVFRLHAVTKIQIQNSCKNG